MDLLVLRRRPMHLVELKYYAGTLTGDDHRWQGDQRAGPAALAAGTLPYLDPFLDSP